jgi:hypothetical protein
VLRVKEAAQFRDASKLIYPSLNFVLDVRGGGVWDTGGVVSTIVKRKPSACSRPENAFPMESWERERGSVLNISAGHRVKKIMQ